MEQRNTALEYRPHNRTKVEIAEISNEKRYQALPVHGTTASYPKGFQHLFQ